MGAVLGCRGKSDDDTSEPATAPTAGATVTTSTTTTGGATTTGTTTAPDADGDGYTATGGDCDDSDADVHPNAEEVCDGVDNDCDGETDEGDAVDAETWYTDADGDGFGDAETAQTACAASGLVADSTDCDDADPAAHPGGEEICDGHDNDCDGTIDADVSDAPTWYADTDGDGWGSAGAYARACDAPSGYVSNDDDCDDTAASNSPASFEICDEVDNDCDGETDEDDALDADIWYADSDDDGFGDAGSVQSACEPPSGYVADATDCDDSAPWSNPDADETCDGVDNDCDGDTDEDDATDAETWYADADGDGAGDRAVTATACDAPSGYTSDDTDCDDSRADVNPSAGERCDGVDTDCDGAVDEDDAVDAETWYEDTDGDGYGDADSASVACDQPAGYVYNDDDCDDTAAATSPASFEICDEIDNDCDGDTDEGSAIDAETWYADSDGDGFGDSSRSEVSCEAPSDGVADDTDCDDNNAVIHPDADEACDEIDNDCDGDTDEDDAVDAETWYADADGDGFGDAEDATVSCEAPSGTTGDDTDCDDTDAAVSPDAVEVWYDGTDGDCDGASDYDADGDGHDASADGGDDGNDADPDCWDTCADGSTQDAAGITCATLLEDFPSAADGTYWIDPDADGDTADASQVWCDMSGGGWTYASEGVPFTVEYTGGTQTIETAGVAAEYWFAAYGAAAGTGGSEDGGQGGVAEGSATFDADTVLYVEVGGQGDAGGSADSGDCNTRVGGYNGGGRGSQGGSAGGGATDLRTADGDLSSRILVGGGGGGCGYESCSYAGGDGGGLSGEDGAPGGTGFGYGGTPTAGGGNSSNNSSGYGSLGLGADNVQCNDEGGGGGGYYGGGAGGTSNATGGGGSAYYGGMEADQSTSTGVNAGDGYVEYVFR